MPWLQEPDVLVYCKYTWANFFVFFYNHSDATGKHGGRVCHRGPKHHWGHWTRAADLWKKGQCPLWPQEEKVMPVSSVHSIEVTNRWIMKWGYFSWNMTTIWLSREKIVTMEFIRKYIHMAKLVKPVLTQEASDYIAEEYTRLRSHDQVNDDLARVCIEHVAGNLSLKSSYFQFIPIVWFATDNARHSTCTGDDDQVGHRPR